MDARTKLFLTRNPYNSKKAASLFLPAVQKNLSFHLENCEQYAKILNAQGFLPEMVQSEADLYKIPPISTLYFKRNRIFSMPEEKLAVKATSSGTQGAVSRIGFDRNTLVLGIAMMLRFFAYHGVVSLIPANYIVLGYEPGHTDMGAVKTAYHTTRFAPALHREYALKANGAGYDVNIEGVRDALLRYARMPFPVRFVGFPSYMYFLVKSLADNRIKLKLAPGSKVLLGGGWKQFNGSDTDRGELFRLIEETTGIGHENCLEFFSAVEHPLPYCKCKNGHFHVPVYSRVIIRDAVSLEPLPEGEPGLLSFVSPFVKSMPLLSVVTDDIAHLRAGSTCGCGIETPYFELLGRAGIRQVKTCAAEAAELMGGAVR